MIAWNHNKIYDLEIKHMYLCFFTIFFTKAHLPEHH